MNDNWSPDPNQYCHCGSGNIPEPFFDARGIYCGKACDKCRKEQEAKFRPEVMNNPNYDCDEPIDEDY